MSGKRYQGAPRATSPKSPPGAYDPECFDDLKFGDKFQVLMQARQAFSNGEYIDALEAKLADLLGVNASYQESRLIVPEVKVQMKPGQVPL